MNYYDNLLKCINNLDNGIEVKENIRCLINIASSIDDCEKWIIKIIKENSVNKVILLNYIAVNLYKSGIYNNVIPLLENALKYDFNNDNTLYNMGYILYKLNENQLALNYLNRITDKNFECNNLIDKVLVKNKPILSICIPTFNRSKRLNKCLYSIFNQIGNDKRFEIVISDNNSDDNTRKMVDYYKNRFDNIFYYKNNVNIGMDRNFLEAIKKAKGNFIFLHGDDDYFKKGTLYKILKLVSCNLDCGIVFLDVLNKKNMVRRIYGIDKFLMYTSIYATFMSSLIIKREDFYDIDNPERMVGTYIPQLYWIYSVIAKNPNILIISIDMYYNEDNNAPGGYIYSFAEVMIENYFSILERFIGKGLNEELIEYDKKRLVDRNLWYFEYGLKTKDKIFIKNFSEVFYKYYHKNDYFPQAWNKILELKEKYKI